MNKQKYDEDEDESYAQIDFLRNDYDCALAKIEQQKADIKRFLILLIEKDIPIPEDLIDRYIHKTYSLKPYDEKLPFD